MANNFDSNFTRKVAKIFMKKFNSTRVMSKIVNTQLLTGRFNPDSGGNVDFKRPTDYVSTRTSDGDIASGDPSPIITGKCTGTVQNYFTVEIDYQEADEAIKMGDKTELLDPAATRIVTDLELDFASFMMKNSALLAGTVGTAADTWDDVAEAGAVLQANGTPMDDPWYFAVNPYTQRKLASNQRSLGAGGNVGNIIKNAHEKATITSNFAGFDRVMTATTLPSYTTWSGADRAGTLTAAPTLTYVGAKDTMTQVLAVTGFTANQQVRAGERIAVSGRYRNNLSTREAIIDENGNQVLFVGTVTTAVTLGASGEGNITITGPGIWETSGAYNTTTDAIASGDVVTLLGSLSTIHQPNLFWHKQAFSIGSVPIMKLHSTDTVATTEDGLQLRVSKGASILNNKQIVRVDLRPAYAVLNPFFAGHCYGS